MRLCVVGPILGIALFIFTSPYDEIRFIGPSLLLLIACAGIALPASRWRGDLAWAGVVALLAMSTSFVPERLADLLPTVAAIAGCGAIIVFGWALLRPRPIRLAAVALAGVAGFAGIYVQWMAFLDSYRLSDQLWSNDIAGYGTLGEAWLFVRREIPADETIAYANTYFVHPLYGYNLNRPAVYAPLRAGLTSIDQLPRIGRPLSGEMIGVAIARLTTADPDRGAWLANLRSAGARHLFVAKGDLTGSPTSASPAELIFAEQDPGHFRRLFDNDAAAVYQFFP